MLKFLKKLFGIKDRVPPVIGSKWMLHTGAEFCVVVQEIKDGWVRFRFQSLNPWQSEISGFDNYTTLKRFYLVYDVQVKE